MQLTIEVTFPGGVARSVPAEARQLPIYEVGGAEPVHWYSLLEPVADPAWVFIETMGGWLAEPADQSGVVVE